MCVAPFRASHVSFDSAFFSIQHKALHPTCIAHYLKSLYCFYL